MPPNNTQVNNEEMSTEDSKAALGLSTRLTEQFLMSQAQQNASVEPETAPEQELEMEQEETPPIDSEALKGEVKNEVVEELKKEMKTIIKDELKRLLNDEDDENPDTKDAE